MGWFQQSFIITFCLEEFEQRRSQRSVFRMHVSKMSSKLCVMVQKCTESGTFRTMNEISTIKVEAFELKSDWFVVHQLF